jgi:hypothetical protein
VLRHFQISHSFQLQAQAGNDLGVFAQYIGKERRARYPEPQIIAGLYERAISEAARRQFKSEAGADQALSSFWNGYLDELVGRTRRTRSVCDADTLTRSVALV